MAVLCYHSVHPRHSFALRPEVFEAHLAWLAAHCAVIPLQDVLRQQASDRPRVAISFDDGYRDNHEVALPLLAKYGMTATFFLTSGFVDGDPAVAARLGAAWQASSNEIEPLSWTQVGELRAAGMSIGAHTVSHPVLGALAAAAVRAELTDSKNRLEDRCGGPITSLAYPYGVLGESVNRETLSLAAETGYELAALVRFRGVRPGDSPLALPRFIAELDSAETLRQKVLGWWDIVSWRPSF